MNKLLIASMCILFVGCSDDSIPPTSVSDEGGAELRTAVFKRINIDGVDCVIGAGTWDSAASVSCDWERKDEALGARGGK